MRLSIKTHLSYTAFQPRDIMLQIEALTDAAQWCKDASLTLNPECQQFDIAAETDMGPRRWIKSGHLFDCLYEAELEINRPTTTIETLTDTPKHEIPSTVIPYLMPSRYCQSDLFLDFVAIQFSGLSGGALVQALSNWVSSSFTYDISASHAGTTATDSFASLAGVCRDYAHMLIALARAGGIPARFVSAYGPDVSPQDFHAVVEVYLQGAWHIMDPTGMAAPSDVARICVGRDAADASFLTSYGGLDLQSQSVQVTRHA